MQTTQEKGTISVHTENIFPIIKKFLYSDHDIFLRELVANAVDASQKLAKLASIGEFNGELGELKIQVSVDKEAKTITVSDRGIGMTAEEIKKYINQIAFSGATEFVEKFKNVDDSKQIIGKFGLGFYSAFMVSDKVEIITRSYREGAEAAHWTCDGTTEFEIAPTDRSERGTDIILHLNADSEEFLDKWRVKGILEKYMRFMPVEIEFDGEVLNNTKPLWTKNPNELKDEDYLSFYRELYPMSGEEPLFWIHLNVDYPFNLTGILYFPKLKDDITHYREKIQLYSRQVFITDEVKDVVPEFLMLLHGVLDSPDIPLNVSRSYLQSDANVKRINSHITKKVADKLESLFKSERENYEKKWESIGVFVKYGMISDEKFADRGDKFAILTNLDGKNFTFEEYTAHIRDTQTDKNNKVIALYTSDISKQDTYIQAAKKAGYDILRLDGLLDNHFIQTLERRLKEHELKRVDSDVVEKLIEKGDLPESVLNEEQKNRLKEIFKKAIADESIGITVESMSPDALPVTVIIPEFMRRMTEMAHLRGMSGLGKIPNAQMATLNANHPLMDKILQTQDEAQQQELALQVYDLGLLSLGLLGGPRLTAFIRRSVGIIA